MAAATATARTMRGVGLAIVLVGIWGGLIPFVGPVFGYTMGDVGAFVWTEGRATLHLAPALAAIAGGLLLARRTGQSGRGVGAVLALGGGAWFVIAPSLHPLWAPSGDAAGGMAMGQAGMSMGGSALADALSALGYHYGPGALIIGLAGLALGLLLAGRTRRAPVAPVGHDDLAGMDDARRSVPSRG